ncbi:FISUMP domain-containing protein [Fibrobacter sp. UWR4]|uniref:FISUMP domain-containing protein n=1 Tax=unclassified Fibrobacter TaxID=2634177 RepID=UPI0035128779
MSFPSGRTALPAGNYNGGFNNVGSNANFWSATENNASNANNWNMNASNANLNNNNKNNGFSVRCLQDSFVLFAISTGLL